MNEQIDLSPELPFSPLDPKNGLRVAEGVAVPIAADRMYQLAALTAGLFLLVTLV
ncbi:hypothetical protein [Tunturiibacter gelidoferens]|uniref:Uncharacterized protein n=2 Tax=Tunturiibacter gelidiferens TaxID=3069689 RepID=A0AAU7Z1G2_9BACT|nr:hypothetical protein [Edaphobacter lichenicola]MBB5341234.1 hypothetical protein [Edaphobacter lichenicola]